MPTQCSITNFILSLRNEIITLYQINSFLFIPLSYDFCMWSITAAQGRSGKERASLLWRTEGVRQSQKHKQVCFTKCAFSCSRMFLQGSIKPIWRRIRSSWVQEGFQILIFQGCLCANVYINKEHIDGYCVHTYHLRQKQQAHHKCEAGLVYNVSFSQPGYLALPI